MKLLTFLVVLLVLTFVLPVGICFWSRHWQIYRHIHSDHVLLWLAWSYVILQCGYILGLAERKTPDEHP